ncbi:MAG: AraC family transcriptional regulator, partial [Clostridiales bacterium]|nr:AraC family transcriptional regulator [Clostridiales bacterium]
MDYVKALESAVIYIENHLGENITVEEVAGVAGYSYYHLTRQFSAILGESIGGYIKKRRLADAAQKLLYTDKKVIDIAFENGFDSSESFSRAFKAAYQLSPAAYRKNRLELLISAKDRLTPELVRHRVRQITVHPQIMTLPTFLAAGLRGQTTLKENVVPKLWAAFNKKVDQIPHKTARERGFGICEACSEGQRIYE